jgi:hypothetical protein
MSACIHCGKLCLEPHTIDYTPKLDDPCECGHELREHKEGTGPCPLCDEKDEVCREFRPDWVKLDREDFEEGAD